MALANPSVIRASGRSVSCRARLQPESPLLKLSQLTGSHPSPNQVLSSSLGKRQAAKSIGIPSLDIALRSQIIEYTQANRFSKPLAPARARTQSLGPLANLRLRLLPNTSIERQGIHPTFQIVAPSISQRVPDHRPPLPQRSRPDQNPNPNQGRSRARASDQTPNLLSLIGQLVFQNFHSS